MIVETGDIVHIKNPCDFRSGKFVIIVSTNQKWALFINSVERKYQFCIPILASNHSFLNGQDRYISCNKPHQYEEADIDKKKGNLNIAELKQIAAKIKVARTIKPQEKAIIIASIESRIAELG
jgi:hypothetical protein